MLCLPVCTLVQIAKSAAAKGGLLPYLWWEAYGDVYTTLKPIAVKITSKQPSASPCERGWSDLEITMGKRRCRFKSSTLGKVLSVRQNLKHIRADNAAGDRGLIYEGLLGPPLAVTDEDYMLPVELGEELEDAEDADGAAAVFLGAEAIEVDNSGPDSGSHSDAGSQSDASMDG